MAPHSTGKVITDPALMKRRLAKRRLYWSLLLLVASVAGSRMEQLNLNQASEVALPATGQMTLKAVKVANALPSSNLDEIKKHDQPQAVTVPSPVTTKHTRRAASATEESRLKKSGTTEKSITPDFSLPYGEPIFVALTLNRISRGSYPIILDKKGDFFIRGDDLKSIGLIAPYGEAKVYEKENYFSLIGLGATGIKFDENQLSLSAEIPAAKLPTHEIDFLGKRSSRVGYPSENSAYLNYRLLNSGSDRYEDDSWFLDSELGIRYHDVLFRNEAAYQRIGDKEDTIRYGTSFTHDDRASLQRLIVGDFSASSGNLGAAMNFGGISFSKSYAINPDFMLYPMAGFVTTITSPSEVDIYLDDMHLHSETVEPGQFEFKNLNYYGGRHELGMVIRDSLGRERRIAYPYYFSNLNLRQGLHDYSYNLGRIRTGVGTSDDEYGDWAISAYHRYGITNSLTVGGRGEAGGGVLNLGPTSVVRMDRWGVVTGAVALSKGEEGSGWAASAAYAYQQRDFNLQTYWRSYASDYEVVGQTAESDRPEQEIVAAAGYALGGIGNVGVSFRQLTQYQGNNQKVASLTYSRRIGYRFRLMVTASHTEVEESSNYFYIGLSYQPGQSLNALLRHQQTDDSYSDAVQIGNTTPVGEGLGYRFTAERNVTDYGQSVRLSPWAQYNGRHGIYMANIQNVTDDRGDSVTGYQWGVSGGIGVVANTVSFSRPISDSFALVDVGGIEGVRVYQSAREVGRTDDNGQLFLPNLGSYQVNHIAIESSDIPIDHSIEETEVERSPPLRSGSLIRFKVNKHQAVAGRLLVKLGTVWLPVEFAELALNVDGTSMVVPTGHGGEFYLENLKPGRFRANFKYRDKRCDFELRIPQSSEMLIELGELNTCEFAQ